MIERKDLVRFHELLAAIETRLARAQYALNDLKAQAALVVPPVPAWTVKEVLAEYASGHWSEEWLLDKLKEISDQEAAK